MNATVGPPPPNDRSVLKQLEGLTLEGGWRIGPLIPKAENLSGGFFSEGYECTHENGERAFLKAIDMFLALQADDMITALNTLTDGVRCEQELLQECKRMDRVVSALAFGYIRELNGHRLLIQIPYIIFERADGSIRNLVRASVQPSDEWCLRTLHHVTTGLMQLHRKRIAHQDVKLSNALHFNNQQSVKLADLGRSIRQDRAVYYDQYEWPGDTSYAPPEVAYGFTQTDFNTRRIAADLFLLGSFACSLFTRVPLNTLLYDRVHPDFRPPRFGGTYAGTFDNVAAHLQEAFAQVIDVIAAHLDADAPYREELIAFIRQWANPDPRERGHPRTRALHAASGNIYDLERYVSALPNMAVQGVRARRQRA